MKFLIVDVDDTLFDWTTMWSRAFNRLLDTLAGNSPELRIALLPAMRELHRAARTSERGLSALDATCLGATSDLASRAGLEFERAATEETSLFPDVLKTLVALRKAGVRVVAHTDTPPAIAADRFVTLGLDGIVEGLFATQNAGAFVHRTHSRTPSRSFFRVNPCPKPNPAALAFVLSEIGAAATECVYLGDSLMKDIPMARALGVCDVHADYGCKRTTEHYELLRAVSHWTDEDIAFEKSLERSEASAKISDFSEIRRFF